MLTVMLNAGFGVLMLLALGMSGGARWGWAVFWGVAAFAVAQVATGFLIQRRIKAAMDGVQKILMDGQKRLQAKVTADASAGQSQAGPDRDGARTAVVVERALEASQELERFNRWAPLMGRQVATRCGCSSIGC